MSAPALEKRALSGFSEPSPRSAPLQAEFFGHLCRPFNTKET
jgi:hypothetical protein